MRRGLERRCGRFPLTQPSAPGAAGITTQGIGRDSEQDQDKGGSRGNGAGIATQGDQVWQMLREPGLGAALPGAPAAKSVHPAIASPRTQRSKQGIPRRARSPAGGPTPGQGDLRPPRGDLAAPGAEGESGSRRVRDLGAGGGRGERCKAGQRRAGAGQGLPQAPPPPRPRRGLWDLMMDRPPGRSPCASRSAGLGRAGRAGALERPGRAGKPLVGGASESSSAPSQ